MDTNRLKERIEDLFNSPRTDIPNDFETLFSAFLQCLNSGVIRAAEPRNGDWQVHQWVKKGILLGFKWGELVDYSIDSNFRFFDKGTYPLRNLELSDSVRLVPGGSSIRTGAYVAPGVVLMPPAYVNVGAYIGAGTMIDSHALVGSCAQLGERVHLSAAAQVGGVLEPIGALPVIIEDDVLVGGNSGIYEGTIVKQGAVIGAGTVLTASIPVYDLVNEERLRRSVEGPLTIPENAVVVPGSRPLTSSSFGANEGLHLQCAVIVKYRDKKTDAATELEANLR
jgi:2,3,4,5-tetrahydropyridine-2-carboxylate N-succinyltransferase